MAAPGERGSSPENAFASNRVAPMSFGQERLWFLEQFEPDTPAYNVAFATRLAGRLDVAALERAIREIRRRHEALRTIFAAQESGAVQVIVRDERWTLPVTDVPADSDAAQQVLIEETQRPFDLSRGPLFRTALLRLGEDDHILACTLHHIVCDGWSIALFTRELASLYAAFVAGKPSPLPELPMQYADFARWQRERLQGELLERGIAWWKGRLGSELPMLQLPTDRPRGPRRSVRGARQTIELPAQLTGSLRDFSRRNNATLFMTLTATFKALLLRHSGQEDIVIGIPVATRSRAETRGLIGFFVNTVALRTDLSGNPTFVELVARVRESALGAYAHHETPIDALAQHLSLARSPDRNPLFQVLVVMEPPVPKVQWPGLARTPVPIDCKATIFDLTLQIIEKGMGLVCHFNYSTVLFDDATIQRMAAQFRALLDAILADPEQRLSDLPLLTFEEREKLFVEWNQISTERPREKRIHELFEQQAEIQLHAIAVVCGERSISYGELNGRANQLAAHLRAHGVGVGTRVGICMERSPEMICGMLGILKACGVYVPLDPSYPKERLNFMIKDAEAPVVVTVEAFEGVLSESGVDVIFLSCDVPLMGGTAWRTSEARQEGRTISPTSSIPRDRPETPKGVAVAHRAIARLVLDTNYVSLGPDDGIAHLSNACFDAAAFEIWGALLNGARLIVISKELALEPEPFAIELKRQGVSTLFLTTALFNELAAWRGSFFQGVKQVLFGGEAVNPHWVGHVLESGPPEHLLHVYGPTECTTFATFYPVRHVPKDATTIPIGRPISNTTAYVLDENRNPVPVGVPGELYLGGPGLAQCYLNQPELTRQKFLSFEKDPDGRVFRTGDRVRWLPDGNIEFLGRLDSQVKLRGFRIEPGEIEDLLRQFPAVKDAVVIFDNESSMPRLIGYVVTCGAAPETHDLRAHLKARLPEYMVPAAFVVLRRWPLTSSGKVDRLALPRPDLTEPTVDHQSPRTEMEQNVAHIWEQVLKIKRIGLYDNFFDAGGHSLLAVQIASTIRDSLGVEVSIRSVFEKPTVAELAAQIDMLRWARQAQTNPAEDAEADLVTEFL